MKFLTLLLLLLPVTCLAQPPDDGPFTLGNPAASAPLLILNKQTYSVGYDSARRGAAFVAYHLSPSDLGSVSRYGKGFSSDNSLPKGYYRVRSTDYTGTRWQRGHLCPAADRTADTTAQRETFLLTNVIPQAPKLNLGTWDSLEQYIRHQVQAGSEAYIVTGVMGKRGYLGDTRIVVPAYCYKVVLLLPSGNDDAVRLCAKTTKARILTVLCPNTNHSASHAWPAYTVTLKRLEKQLGYSFFVRLPLAVKQRLAKRSPISQ